MNQALRIAMIAFAGSVVAVASPANAGTGCNGVVNIFVWGCAPWDNNNGPQHQYYRKKAISIPKQGTQIVSKNGVQMALRNGQYFPLIGQDGNSIIGNDAGSLRVWSQ